MSERSGQTAKGKDGKTKYASLNLFDTYKGKSLEAQKPVVPARHGLQSLGKVASTRRMPPPANLPSLKAENKGNDPNVSLVPKDRTTWASKQEPAEPKSTDVLSAPQLELQQPVASPTPVPTQPRTPPAPEAPVSALAAGARSWAQASVTHGTQGDGGKGSNQPSPFSREEFPTLQAAGEPDKAGREQATADQWYGPGPSLRPQNVTSWRDGGGRVMAPTQPGEAVVEGGAAGALVMEGAAGAPPLQQQNPPSHGPPRNPPAGSPALPLPQPPVGPQFPAYRGLMPPFMYLPFPAPYGPQGPYRYPPPNEAPRFSRAQGGPGPDGRTTGGPRGGGEVVKRPSILKQDDLKELDELDHDGDEGWAGAQEEIDYSAKLKFSDDEGEEDGEDEKSDRKNGARESCEQLRPPDCPNHRPRTSDSGGDTRRTPPSAATADSPPPTSSKPGWAEEGWGGQVQCYPPLTDIRPCTLPQDRSSGPTVSSSQQQAGASGGITPPPPSSGVLLHQPAAEDEDETWRQRRKQSSSEISAAVERARRRREEEERRMEEERRAACAEKLKRLDEKQQQQQQSSKLVATSESVPATSPSPSPSPNVSQPASPCVDTDEAPRLSPQPAAPAGGGVHNRQRASSNSSYDSSTETQQAPPPPPAQQQPVDSAVARDGKEEALGVPVIRRDEALKVETVLGGGGRQTCGPPGQGYSKYQKSLPPRFQRQQQEQLLKQQQQWQQQHGQAAQGPLQSQPPAQQGPAPGTAPQAGPKQPQLYPPGSMGRPPHLPMNFDPRWMMMPYMDPRMMQGRPPPMDYYAPNMHPTGLMGRERSDSGGSGSDPFDRQQHGGPSHPHRGTPPIDPKLAWGPEVFPGDGEGRALSSPLRQKQPLEEEEVGKGLRSNTPPVRIRDSGPGPMVTPTSPSNAQNQTPPPVGTQVGGQGGGHHPHHQPFMGAGGSYSGFPDAGTRMSSQQQQRGSAAGLLHGFSHQDEGTRGGQQGHIWGPPHPQYDRNGRADISPMENNPHVQHHHGHPPAPHFSLYPHKQENGRAGEPKKTAASSLHQPSLSSSCSSSSSSSSSAREDGSGKHPGHLRPPKHEHDHNVPVQGGGRKGDKMGSAPQSSQHAFQQQHLKPNQRGREHKTETQWGPRPGTSSTGSSHGRKANTEESVSSVTDHRSSNQTGGNKRVGSIKRPVLKENKREGGEGEGAEKVGGSTGKEKEQEGGPPSQVSSSVAPNKDDSGPSGKPRNGGKDRAGGGGKVSKDGDGFSAPSSKRDRERSHEGGNAGGGVTYHPTSSSRGSRASRARGEFYSRGRGYRGTYTGSAGGGGSRGRAGSRSSRDFRSSGGYHHPGQDYKHEAPAGNGRHVQGGAHTNPARARNRSETRSEGSEYEEVPKRRRQRDSETGSESAASDHSEKDDRKPNTKNSSENPAPGTCASSAPPRNSQARVFTPRGVPSRRGRGGGGAGGGHRSAPGSGPHSWSSKSSSTARKQHPPLQPPPPKDSARGGGPEKKEKPVEQTPPPNQAALPTVIAPPTPAQQGVSENGGVANQLPLANQTSNSVGSGTQPPPPLSGPDGRPFPPRGFDRPPRRRRHGRSQHQQDKPPRFRRLKQERENAARINGGGAIIGPSSPATETEVANATSTTTPAVTNSNHSNTTATANNNNNNGHLGSHRHHHYSQSSAPQPHPQHHHNPPTAAGAKSPDISNQNSDQANEEWETASESSDFNEFREREAGGGGGGGGGKPYNAHHHHPAQGRPFGGGGDREMMAKELAANKRSFSSQRPGMERQNRRVNTGGGGGRGPRAPPGGGGGGGGADNGGMSRGERRGNWPSPKNRK
uniref:BAT2 N-terminal domain-containing protein n=1 Tax=Denticeps clupeoides TaxID=299321 RepID=A0AAY4BKF3_9TELE